MHGIIRWKGEGSCGSSRSSINWHMHPTVIAADSNSFFKGGRKVSIGDCALFKIPQESPPFVGLIRSLTLTKDNNLQLGVNRLYRPAELKLGKGSSLDGAPNEIFYSFHKDEIPAASLYHPCKVAFLPKGSELLRGTYSFVCRRVYDIESKCLWWLTDQDYFNELREEVDQLLYKTTTEMHGTLQPGGRSPRHSNGPTLASQSKPGSENVQNSGSSFPSHVKGKKRERGDHSTEPVKRERLSRTDDGDSAHYKAESSVKNDIARITDKGGLVDVEGVEKLVQLMQPDRVDKKMDLNGRSMLAAVVASTEKAECLNRFVQLRGLPILDEWLQDIHKGKVGGGNSSKDGDEFVEEFLLVLLRALDKLPVNLHALQTCNIGRSVNHLRSHKNVDIQRKARSLVDTWKKRVEAEINSIDAKSGSSPGASVWSSKSRPQEASHGGSRTPSGSDVALKSSITQHSASKTSSVKSLHGDCNTKSASSSPGPRKPASPAACGKESQPGISVVGTSDVPQIREDRSSSSNQSHSYSQSSLGKEEGKSTPVSTAASKISGSSSRNRKVSGLSGVSEGQRENSSSRSFSVQRSATSDKLSPSALTSERVVEGPSIEASNQKLIVKIPNRVRSPTQGVSAVSLGDPSIMSSQTSPQVLSDKFDHFDNLKEKSDTLQCSATDMNVVSCEINDNKDISTGFGDGAGSPAVIPDEEKGMSTQDSRKSIESSRNNQLKCGKLHESSFSPMNALIESCAKYSEAHSSFSLEDDVGMNLLASVATGEMSRLDLVSPTDSTERSTPTMEEVCFEGDEAKSKSSPENHIRGSENQFSNEAEEDGKKQAGENGSYSEDGLLLAKQASLPADINSGPSHTCADMPAEASNSADAVREVDEKSNQNTDTKENTRRGETNKEIQEGKVSSSDAIHHIPNCASDGTNATVTVDKASKDILNTDKGKVMVEVASSNRLYTIDCKSDVNERLDMRNNSMQEFTAAFMKPEFSGRSNDEKLQQDAPGLRLLAETEDDDKLRESEEMDTKGCISESKRDNFNRTVDRNTAPECHSIGGACSTTDGHKSQNKDLALENKVSAEHVSLSERGVPAAVAHEGHKKDELSGSKHDEFKADESDSGSTAAEVSSSAAAPSDPNAKLDFDLNEDFTIDDEKYGETVSLVASVPASVQMTNTLQFSVSSIPTLHPASITVAAAAKGPFLPPEDLLRTKGELGWKGSAATSAFRPAEPRKVTEMPLASMNLPDDASTSKNVRPMLDIDLNIDLNVADEKVIDEMVSRDSRLSFGPTTDLVNNRVMLLNESSGSMPVLGSGGLHFDLNRVDESNENGPCSASRNRNCEVSLAHVKPLGGLPLTDVQRGFDLNDRPGLDDASADHFTISQQVKVGVQSHLPSAGLRTNNPGMGSFSSWFSPGNTYSTVGIPSAIPDRADQPFPVIPPGAPQRTFGPAGISPFTPDVYRGSVLSSSAAVSFPSSPFQFPVFPFGPSFPIPSANFPAGATSYADSSSGARLYTPPVNSHLLAPVGAISSQFQRSYMVGLPESSSNSGLENSRKWGRQGLDLNAGPGAVDSEVREDMLPLSSNQHSVAISQVQAEEQARMYQMSGNILKRTEPEGGWDRDSFRYKQPWQ